MATRARHPSLVMVERKTANVRDRWAHIEAEAPAPAPEFVHKPLRKWKPSGAAPSLAPAPRAVAVANAQQMPAAVANAAPIKSAVSKLERKTSLERLREAGALHSLASNPWLARDQSTASASEGDVAASSNRVRPPAPSPPPRSAPKSVAHRAMPVEQRYLSFKMAASMTENLVHAAIHSKIAVERQRQAAAVEHVRLEEERHNSLHAELETTKAHISIHHEENGTKPAPHDMWHKTTNNDLETVFGAGAAEVLGLLPADSADELTEPSAPPVDRFDVSDTPAGSSSIETPTGSAAAHSPSQEDEVQKVPIDETQVSLEQDADSDHLNIRICTWNCGNAAPPDDLNVWLPRSGNGAHIVAIAAQEATYPGTTATEEILGTVHGRIRYVECPDWGSLLGDQMTPKTAMHISMLAENAALGDAKKQQSKTQRVAPGQMRSQGIWSGESFDFNIYKSTYQMRFRIWEAGFASSTKRAESNLFFNEGRLESEDGTPYSTSEVLHEGGSVTLDLALPLVHMDRRTLGYTHVTFTFDIEICSGLPLASPQRQREFSVMPRRSDDHFVSTMLQQLGSQYTLLREDQDGGNMVGFFGQMRLLIFVRNEIRSRIHGCEMNTKATGVGNLYPNKGGIVAKLHYLETSFCFVCAHLAPHEGAVQCEARNYMARRIQEGARVGDVAVDLTGQFDHVFWAGDLNYRNDLPKYLAAPRGETITKEASVSTALEMIANKRLGRLYTMDELHHQIGENRVFAGGFQDAVDWEARNRQRYFDPTFKVIRQRRRGHYVLNRVPSWCDRVLWATQPGNNASVFLQGVGSDTSLSTSDHKPVYAGFRVAVPKPLALRLDDWLVRHYSQGSGRYKDVKSMCTVVRVVNLRASGLSAQGTYTDKNAPGGIRKCKPVVEFKAYGALTSAASNWAHAGGHLSGVAASGTGPFVKSRRTVGGATMSSEARAMSEGSCMADAVILPLFNVPHADLLLSEQEDPADPSRRVTHSESLTLCVRDSAGHKHPGNGAVIGIGRVSLRWTPTLDSPYGSFEEEHVDLRSLKSDSVYAPFQGPTQLGDEPVVSEMMWKEEMLVRDFHCRITLNGSARLTGMVSGQLQIYHVLLKPLHARRAKNHLTSR